MTSIVSLDIETTGLDPKLDAIIEIGIHRFSGQRKEGEYSKLINPNRHISDFITGLTGIDDAMVRNAPRIQDVLEEVAAFIGSSPVLGHNIRFDLSFFEKYHLFEKNERIDSYELAAVLLPEANRYNLGALGKQLGIPLPATHRGLDDARVTAAVYTELVKRAHNLPLEILAEIVRYTESVEWDGTWAFRQVLKSRSHESQKASRPTSIPLANPFTRPSKENARKYPVLQVPDEPLKIDPDAAASLMEHGGPFSKFNQSFEHRPEQLEMLRAVSTALSTGQHLMVEAGTGVGKSFAYLVPAALFALENNTRVLISTNTINLQDQLIKKDIPDLCTALDLDLRAAVLKGRSNYLCPRRLKLMRQRMPSNPDELRVLAKVLVWLLGNQSGDRTELNLTGPSERDVWLHLSAEDDVCTSEVCLEREGGSCPFYRARQAAINAHILVVNHALLLTDVAVGNRLLPDYQHVILDEGHHLESATTNALSFRMTQADIDRLIREAGGAKSGILGNLIQAARDNIRPSDFALLGQKIERATDFAWRLQEQCRHFFITLGEFVANQREGQPTSTYAWQERILPSSRVQPGWDGIEVAWSSTRDTMNSFIKLMSELQKNAADLYISGAETLEEVIGNMGNLYLRMVEVESMLSAMIFEPDANSVYWVEVNPNTNRLAVNAAPVQIGPLVEKHLWHEKRSVIVTSATLTTHGNFDYLRNILSADEADELALGSPFDYQNSALLYITEDIAEPHTKEYQHQVEKVLINLCRQSGGRTMVLFTSYAQLRKTARAITGPLAQENIYVYEQGDGASANTLLESFKSSERAVLLGTRAFWEGVDIPGEALSILVIAKLPFAVPTDPLVAARSETFEDPFNQYHLPEAILRLRQGVGRLIRTQSDRGVIVILDRRVLTKPYGRAFLESLPDCTRRQGSLADLPKHAIKWIE